MKILAMDIPPFQVPSVLPVAAVGFALASIARALGAERIGADTLLPLGLACAAIGATATFVYWFATERAETKAEQKRLADQAQATHDLLKLICESVPEINEKHWRVQQLLRESEATIEGKGTR